MFAVYRNSLKNNQNNNSNGFETGVFTSPGQSHTEPHSKPGSTNMNHLYSTTRNGGFYHDSQAQPVGSNRVHQRKNSDHNAAYFNTSTASGGVDIIDDLQSMHGTAGPGHFPTMPSPGTTPAAQAAAHQAQTTTLKVQELLRNANNKSGGPGANPQHEQYMTAQANHMNNMY